MFFEKKESKLENRVKLVHIEDFALPVIGWFTYAKRDAYPDKVKEKLYSIAVNTTQFIWTVGLVVKSQDILDSVYNFLQKF